LRLETFYSSLRWIKLSRAFMKSKNYICEQCNNRQVMTAAMRYGKRLRMICHHRIPLTEDNFRDVSISLNTENLMCLCINCHNNIHGNKAATVPGLVFNSSGQVVPKS